MRSVSRRFDSEQIYADGIHQIDGMFDFERSQYFIRLTNSKKYFKNLLHPNVVTYRSEFMLRIAS